MAKAEIFPGNCGFRTFVETRMDGNICLILIQSDYKAIRRMAEDLTQVEP